MTGSDRAWVATRKGLFELRCDGAAWAITNVAFLGEPVSAVLLPDGEGRMMAALNLGHFGVKTHVSENAGRSWHEVATPTYPAQPQGVEGPAWKLQLTWVLERSGSTVWAGTLPGGLFRSPDFGQSWQLVDALWNVPGRSGWFGGGYDVPGIHSICPHPTREHELLVGVSSGGVWHTADDGQTWASRCKGLRATYVPPEQAEEPNVQDPHAVRRCFAQPDVLWCQHHNGIWRSDDNAMSWRPIEAPVSSFGFAVAPHPHDANTAWFVPAQADERRVPVGAALVVNRTRDAGRSFDSLRTGLPQKHAYDLIYRHGLAVADDGVHLMMGSTTGNVWSSADGGERWVKLDAHLPPVFAVHFG